MAPDIDCLVVSNEHGFHTVVQAFEANAVSGQQVLVVAHLFRDVMP